MGKLKYLETNVSQRPFALHISDNDSPAIAPRFPRWEVGD